ALLAGFVLLPFLGVERSFLLLASGYGVVALLLVAARRPSGEGARFELRAVAPAGVLLVALPAFFPLGLTPTPCLGLVGSGWASTDQLVGAREGLPETVLYLRRDLWGEPFSYRLVTNGFSMSGTWFNGRRYMGLFVYLPLAIQPEAKRAL